MSWLYSLRFSMSYGPSALARSGSVKHATISILEALSVILDH